MSFIKKKKSKNVGQFIPRNPEKYIGKYPIIIRSSWERKMCQWLDANSNVIQWSSESHCINYFDPVMEKRRRYYPDFFVIVKTKDGKHKKFLIEVKPYHETIPPKRGRKSESTIRTQELNYLTNMSKWKAARDYCRKMGIDEFKLLTEKEMFKK